jgi:hypothetical protein
MPLLVLSEILERRRLRVEDLRGDSLIRVWLARRGVRGRGGLGNGIPDDGRRNRSLEGKGALVLNAIRADPTDEGANHPAANQQTSFRGDKVNIDMGPWKEPHIALHQEPYVGHIDDVELATSTKAYLRYRLVAGRRASRSPTPITRALIQQ